ncbi:MAG: methyltransferase domain-containing protein [Deltaproteobacteria bacterium]|jgi:phospholipid N-methyltransferase|nr:methyltransferase domain-containing protein [Deltaproteobacteria bacterium]
MKINTLYYLKNLITDIHVASVTPTSRFGVEKVLEKIDFQKNKVILEYGPGTGNFTEPLLKNMTENSKLIAIEKNSDFCRVLQRSIQDPRLFLFEDSAENVLDILKSCNGAGDLKADCIISGIPFSLLPKKRKMAILKNTHAALKKGGKFLAYQAFFQFPDILKIPLEELFGDVQAQYYMFSLPPLLILEAVKKD